MERGNFNLFDTAGVGMIEIFERFKSILVSPRQQFSERIFGYPFRGLRVHTLNLVGTFQGNGTEMLIPFAYLSQCPIYGFF